MKIKTIEKITRDMMMKQKLLVLVKKTEKKRTDGIDDRQKKKWWSKQNYDMINPISYSTQHCIYTYKKRA